MDATLYKLTTETHATRADSSFHACFDRWTKTETTLTSSTPSWLCWWTAETELRRARAPSPKASSKNAGDTSLRGLSAHGDPVVLTRAHSKLEGKASLISNSKLLINVLDTARQEGELLPVGPPAKS
eukprot:767661-Hanusia_phi.AAC.3